MSKLKSKFFESIGKEKDELQENTMLQSDRPVSKFYTSIGKETPTAIDLDKIKTSNTSTQWQPMVGDDELVEALKSKDYKMANEINNRNNRMVYLQEPKVGFTQATLDAAASGYLKNAFGLANSVITPAKHVANLFGANFDTSKETFDTELFNPEFAQRWAGESKGKKLYTDVIGAGAGMAADLLAAAGTGNIAKISTPKMQGIQMGARYVNEKAVENEKEGKNYFTSYAKNIPAGIIQAKLEGISKESELLNNAPTKQVVKHLVKKALGEATEEGAQQLAEDIYDKIVNRDITNANKKPSEIAYDTLYSALIGGILGGGTASIGVINSNINQPTQNVQPTVQNQENVQPIQQNNTQNGQISNNINSNELSQQVDTINQNNLETSLKNDLNSTNFNEKTEKIQIKENHNEEQKKIIEEYHNSTDENFIQFIKDAREKEYVPSYKLEKINSNLAKKINEIVGFDTTNYNNEINKNAITHIDKRHGLNGEHDQSMANDIDLARVQYVINNFDDVKKGKKKNKEFKNKDNTFSETILISKKMDGVYYVVEAVPENKSNTLHIISAYINEDNKKSSAISSDEMENNISPSSHVQDELELSTTNNIISQDEQNMQVQNENTKQPINLNTQMFSGESDLERAQNVIQEGQGQERLKSFYETANESEMLNDEAKRELAIKRASDGTYYQKSMQQTKDEANEFIHTLEARDEYSQYEKAVDLIKRNELTNTGIESAILTEAVNYFQNQGDYERASQIIEDIEELTQKSGRNIQYLNAWRSLGPRGKWRFVERAVEKYNQTNTGKNKPITITEEDRTNFETSLANFEKELENNIDNAKQELIDNGYFNNKLEKISSEMILNDITLSNEELKDSHTKEEMMKIFNRGDSSTLKKVSTYQTISHLLNTSTFSRNFISNVAFKNLEKIAQKFNKVILGDYSVVDLKLNEQGQLAVKEAKSKATKKTALDILLGIEGIDNTRHTKTTSGTVKNALPSFKNKVLNTAEKGLALELKVPDERTKADVRETIIQQFKQKLGEEGYKKNQKEIEQYADEQAKYVTFQDDTALSKLMKNFKDLLNNGSEFGIGDFLVKYTQVPANVVSRAIEYSPLGALKAVVGVYDIQNKVRTGKMSIVEANKRATKLGRSLTGTVLMGLGILLSKYGILTSNKEDDEEIKNILKDAGVTDGNINISQIKRLFDGTYDGNNVKEGDITFTIDWLQPASMIINNGAILYKDLYETDNSGNVLWDIAENTLDLPSNQSLSTILKAVQYKSKDQDIGEAITYGVGQALGDSIAGTLIPSFIRHWSNAIDPVSRNVYANKSDKGTFSQYLAQPVKKTVKNIPFASKTLEPNITAEGKEKTYFDGGTILNYLIQSSPLRVTKVDMIEGIEALKDIMTLEDGTTISTTSNMPLRYAPNKTQYTKDEEGNKIILSDKDKTEYMTAYSKYYIENYLKYLDKIKEPKTMTDKQKENVAKQLGNINQKAKKYAEKEALSNN